jgi:hypothetical protein
VLSEQRHMGMELKKSLNDQRDVALNDQKSVIMQKRQYQVRNLCFFRYACLSSFTI